MRNFRIDEQFDAVKGAATAAIKEIFPIEGKLRAIKLAGVSIDDSASATDYAGQNKTKGNEGTWGAGVYANLELIDKATGKVIDRNPKIKLFTLPKPTARFSYIVKGNEYQVHNQLRLKPGVYTIKKQNGELKTQVNLAKGKNFDLAYDESSGIFRIQKIGGGQANIPLYPILINLGLSPQAIAKEWGNRLAQANHSTDQKAVARAEVAFGLKSGSTLNDYFQKTELRPDTTKIVLGKEFERVDAAMLLAASKNLLEVHLGKKEPTDRDSLEFKELHSVEDFIKERLEKNKQALAFRIKRNIDNVKRTKLSQIVNPGSFSSVVESFFTQDDKAATPEQTNPLEMLSGQYKATIMGSGGITSRHALTPEMRNIHPSQYGFIDPIHTPESERIGANLHLPLGVVKDGKEIKMVVIDKKGKELTITPTEAYDKKIAFPGQTGNNVKVNYRGQTIEVPRSQVDYTTPSASSLFSWSTNLIPFLPSNQGNRAMMASKMLEQAISLKHREAPLVQVAATDKFTMEQAIGRSNSATAPADGTVKKITNDFMVLSTASGDVKVDLYNHFTLNRKSFIHHHPVVSVGDKVKKGQLLADTNYTKDGTLALGTNLRAAYIPYKGLNFEDGIVITESAADKLTSEHIHKKHLDFDENTVLSLTAFKSFYPNALTSQNYGKLDDEGVIKKGSRIKMGEVLIAALRKKSMSRDIALLQKQLADRPRDVSLHWTMEDDGVVMDVQRSKSSITILVKTEEKAKIGDKLAGRFGNKGIITKIIPDSSAPHDAGGKPVDILLNPHGVISRINIGQIYESAAAKAAAKAGEVHTVSNFSGENYLDKTKKFLDKHKVSDKEELIDPETGKSLGQVHVGNPYILKLFKQGTANFSVRQGGPGHAYDVNMQPLKAGGEDGSKAMDLLTVYSMLSHGARANLREMSSIKSDQNDEFWKALKSGQTLPPPKATFAYDKFISYLKGAGIDVQKDGSKLTLAPLTDKQVLAMSSGEVKKPLFYRAKDMEPIRGGFFDPITMGGLKGTKWGHLELHEPVVNPVFENAVRKVTDLGKKYDSIVEGKLYVDKDGKLNKDGDGVTGGKGIERLLGKIDVDAQIEALSRYAVKAKGAQLDDANKKLRYLTALKDLKLKPQDAYMRKHVPVLPPQFRPVYPLPDGNITTSDVNVLYQNTGVLNTMMKLPVMDMLPDHEKADLRRDLNEHVKGISGLTDVNIKGRPREGLISEIKGGSGGQPKEGYFISKLLSKKQDFVGRGTIIPEPDLGVDEVAIPEEMAWKLFEPFLVRELKNQGKSPLQALEEIKQKTNLAKKALEIVMRGRHILLNRAPSLHKFSVMAFKPKITDGRAIKIPPLVVTGFNADFDGDTMTAHVPITEEANREAEKMLPSRNLFQPGTGKLMIAPSQEAQVGLFYLSKTPAGRTQLNQLLPSKFAISDTLDKKRTRDLLQRLATELKPNEFGAIVAKLKAEGEKHAFERGFTLGVNDLVSFGAQRDKVVKAVNTLVKNAPNQKALMDVNNKATQLVDMLLDKKLKDKDNPLYDMVASGARGSKDQLRSIMATPLLVSDARGRVVPSAIKKSYAEGLDIGDYWTSMYGARRGMMDRAIQTSLPGAFSKDIMATTLDNVISAKDCGTKKGRTLSIDDKHALERFLATDQEGVTRNTLVTNDVVARMKKNGAKTITVRSPLFCLQPKGTCAKCFGLDEHGQEPDVGENIGAKAGQTISEPLIQMVMNCSEGNITLADGRTGAFMDFYEESKADIGDDGHCQFKNWSNSVFDVGTGVSSPVIQTHAPDADLIFIKTKNGHTMLVQENHPIWVYTKDGEASECFAGDANKSNYLMTDRSPVMFDGKDPDVDGYVTGIFLAEGSTRYGNGTARYNGVAVASIITQSNKEIRNKVFGILESVSGSSNNKLDVQIYNPAFAKKLASIVRGREAKLKRFAPGFNMWSKDFLAQVLAGWVDGDGTVFNKNGTTVAQVYTSSFIALQQLEIICSKLGVKFTPQVVTKRPLQKTVQFIAQLRFFDECVYRHSIKMQNNGKLFLGKHRIKKNTLDRIVYVKKLWGWDLPVWDIKTETRGFTCGMVRNHNTFHTGGAAGTGADAGGFQRVNQLLQLPKIVTGAAPLSPVEGKVRKIEQGAGGGHIVHIDDQKVFVPHGRKLFVAVGSKVEKGDALSDGVVKPQDLVKYKGMEAAQNYITDELHKAYAGQGVNLHKKMFETVVRSLGNTTQVLNNPNDSDVLPGDIVPYTMVQHYNANLEMEKATEEAVGYKLAKSYGPLREGHELDERDVKMLRAAGNKTILVRKDAIKHAPVLKGMSTLPLLRKDWMASLGYRNLAKALVEGAGQRWSTDLSGYHPVPALAHGTTFGKGQEGKY